MPGDVKAVPDLSTCIESLREQLKVLHILDNTAADWPGVVQSVEDISHRCSAQQRALDKAASRQTEAERRSEQLERERDSLSSDLQNERQQLDRTRDELQNAIREVKGAEQKHKAAVKALKRQHVVDSTELQAKVRQLEAKAQQQAAVEAAISEGESAAQQVHELTAQLYRYKTEASRNSERLSTLERQLVECQELGNDLQAENSELEVALHTCEEECESLRESNQALSDELEQIMSACKRSEELSGIQARVLDERRQEERDSMAAEGEAVRRKAEEAVTEAKAQCRAEVERLECVIAALKIELNVIEGQREGDGPTETEGRGGRTLTAEDAVRLEKQLALSQMRCEGWQREAKHLEEKLARAISQAFDGKERGEPLKAVSNGSRPDVPMPVQLKSEATAADSLPSQRWLASKARTDARPREAAANLSQSRVRFPPLVAAGAATTVSQAAVS
mmetsp:Transcript_9978/g.28652  ORF Transcript_9978/g.28652 Transcript_9978/m.28652 type:complete len:452 (+) Transcript_9978:263-1618(+)